MLESRLNATLGGVNGPTYPREIAVAETEYRHRGNRPWNIDTKFTAHAPINGEKNKTA